MAQWPVLSDKKLHGAAVIVLVTGLLLAFVRPQGASSGPPREIPHEYSIVVETRLPTAVVKLQQATIHLPQLPLSARLALDGNEFRCHIHSFKPPQSFLVTLYLAGGEQAIGRGELI